jgi:hypothetical protein
VPNFGRVFLMLKNKGVEGNGMATRGREENGREGK